MKLSYDSMILSASGWRKVFALSGNEQDSSPKIGTEQTLIVALMAQTFVDFLVRKTGQKNPIVVIGTDSRPTGAAIADAFIRVLHMYRFEVAFLGVCAAPEIMACARTVDGFVYISASHNPIGHNGVKFGLSDGGVLSAEDANPLADDFKERCNRETASETAEALLAVTPNAVIQQIYQKSADYKKAALEYYTAFTKEVITAETDKTKQDEFFAFFSEQMKQNPIAVVCDMNGSARTLSIDEQFLRSCGIGFYAINAVCGTIAHEIIPEPENLIFCAQFMKELHEGKAAGISGAHPEAILGYMPDCDGDRGNIVYWNNKTGSPEILKAQEVFALCVLAETAYLEYCGKLTKKTAISVNDPTSMRIEEIASAFGACVVRAEVGEANVVNLAREKREQGFTVRILGEGSNGGNITHPAAVRDPLNSIFALLKLLIIKDSNGKKGLFHLWCERSGQLDLYKENFTLSDIIAALPRYVTTGVSEKRALANIKNPDHAMLKKAYQTVFESEWAAKKEKLKSTYGIFSYEAVCNNRTKETRNLNDFSVSARGGLKILFYDKNGDSHSFIWMRGSGTEPVFRILCDVKVQKNAAYESAERMEAELLEWHTNMLLQADKLSLK